MRQEAEILELVKRTALDDSRISSAFLRGSRASGRIKRDVYQDYDIEYYVSDLAPYWDNISWLESVFGRTLIVQMPVIMDDPDITPEMAERFTYLAIFSDGVRIDLSLVKNPFYDNGEPAILLVDKDGGHDSVYGDDSAYLPLPPSKSEFDRCCNEFWWCVNNLAKGIARGELPYAMNMLGIYIRPELDRMLGWLIGSMTDFSAGPGKLGRFMEKYLPDSMYKKYLKTFPQPSAGRMWTSCIEMCKLFSDAARITAKNLGLEYNSGWEDGIRIYIDMIRSIRS